MILIKVLIFAIVAGLSTCLLCCFRIGQAFDDDVYKIDKDKEREK